jgi:hypothetical protein
MKCRKDNNRICGAGWRNSVFELKVTKSKTEVFNTASNVR